jgi:hypothetical protein
LRVGDQSPERPPAVSKATGPAVDQVFLEPGLGDQV